MDAQPRPVNPLIGLALGVAGALAGGIVGYFAFGWLAGQGFYALALPGVLVGVGAGWFPRERSLPLAVGCGILALVLGVFAEWKHFPFVKDESFGYFVTHLSDLRPFTLLMLAVGAVAGFWFAWRVGSGPTARTNGTSIS
jgi:hypothetical protein